MKKASKNLELDEISRLKADEHCQTSIEIKSVLALMILAGIIAFHAVVELEKALKTSMRVILRQLPLRICG
ncbi:MAG: hypothetical protein ONB32_06215 [candidate division KSB1 bacterium]|nr:hypothetical protein [candidate division KSB1 bacterium]